MTLMKHKIKKAVTRFMKKPKQWYMALTNAAMMSAVSYLNIARGYLLTSLRVRNRAHRFKRFKAVFMAGLNSNKIWRRTNSPNTCRHLKGGSFQGNFKDYNVLTHTFVDGSTKIWCANGCGFVSTSKDDNWSHAVHMAERSSNHASASERLIRNDGVVKNTITVVYADRPE